MRTYYIDYVDFTNGLCHLSVNANNIQEAEERANLEYGDVNEIVNIK